MRKLRQTGRRLPAGRRLSEALERSPPAARESTSPPLSDAARADARPSTGPIMPAAAGVSTGIPADHVSPVARTVRAGVSARRSGGPPLRPRQLSHKSLSRASTLSPHFPARTGMSAKVPAVSEIRCLLGRKHGQDCPADPTYEEALTGSAGRAAVTPVLGRPGARNRRPRGPGGAPAPVFAILPAVNWIKPSSCSATSPSRRRSATSDAGRSSGSP